MTGRLPTWRLWAGLACGLAAYGALGWWWSSNGTVEEWMYRIGLTAAAILPLVFTGIYTWIGIKGPVAAAWWKDQIGTSLVLAALSIVPIAGPLAWVFWVDNGVLSSSWLAWVEVSGPCLSALAWLRICYIWAATAWFTHPDTPAPGSPAGQAPEVPS